MADTQTTNPNVISGIDFSQYLSWKKIVAPNGATYYKVPNTGFLYDPFTSGIKGRPVLWTDPSPQVADKEKAQKLAENAASPQGQLLPIGGALVGTVGGAYLIDKFRTPTANNVVLDKSGNVIVGKTDGSYTVNGQAPVPSATSTPAPQTSSVGSAPAPVAPGSQSSADAFAGTVQQPPVTAVNQLPDGSVTMSDGSIVAPGGSTVQTPSGQVVPASELSKYLPYAQTLLGAYNAYHSWKDGNKATAAVNAGQAGVGVANLMGYGTGKLGGYLGGAADVAQLGENWHNIDPEDRGSRIEQQVGLGVADYFTGGLAGLAANAFKATPFGEKIDRRITNLQNKASKYGLDPMGFGLNALFGHKSTKQYQDERWKSAVDQGLVPQEVAESWLNSDGSKETRTSDQILEQAKGDGKQLWGTLGMFQTFGQDWMSKYTEAQREAISRGIAQAGIIHSDKGDWFIDDPNKAHEIADQVVKGGPGAIPGGVQGSNMPTPGDPAAPPPRSQTKSPGISLSGQPIDYSSIGKQIAQRLNQNRSYLR